MTIDLFSVRSMLFLPASNPRAIARAREAGSDMVVLDLEDAVKPEDKLIARSAAVDSVRQPWPMLVAIRLNSAGSEWYDGDIEAVRHSGADVLIVPRVTSADELMAVKEWADRPVLAMVETAAGVLAAAEIAHSAAGLIAGTNDLAADLRLPPGAGRGPLQAALQMIVLAARATGIAVFDGVFNQLDDAEGFAAECAEVCKLGFDGKSLIHPNQIEPCNRAFSPSEQEIERARALIAAFSGGAKRFEDRMIERMHVEQARRLLERRA